MSKHEEKTIDLPEGFELVSDGTLSEAHDFDKDAIVMGPVVTIKTLKVKRGAKLEDARMITVNTGETVTAVWESAGLKDLFDGLVIGDTVYIKYDGKQSFDDSREDMKTFITGVQRTGVRSGKA